MCSALLEIYFFREILNVFYGFSAVVIIIFELAKVLSVPLFWGRRSLLVAVFRVALFALSLIASVGILTHRMSAPDLDEALATAEAQAEADYASEQERIEASFAAPIQAAQVCMDREIVTLPGPRYRACKSDRDRLLRERDVALQGALDAKAAALEELRRRPAHELAELLPEAQDGYVAGFRATLAALELSTSYLSVVVAMSLLVGLLLELTIYLCMIGWWRERQPLVAARLDAARQRDEMRLSAELREDLLASLRTESGGDGAAGTPEDHLQPADGTFSSPDSSPRGPQ